MRTFTSSLLVLAAASCVATQSTFALVPLEPPDNWQAGPNLFPSQVIAGYKDNLTASDGNLTVWTEDSWAVHVLSLCASFSACTSSVTFQANNSGSDGGRFWFGYVFRGGPTVPSDYARAPNARAGVNSSRAYTIVE